MDTTTNSNTKIKKTSAPKSSLIRLDINKWIIFFAFAWFNFLLFNTNNPLNQIMTISFIDFMNDTSPIKYVQVIGSGIVYFVIIILGLYLAGGKDIFSRLLNPIKKHQTKTILLGIIGFVALYVLGNFLAVYIPTIVGDDVSKSISMGQWVSVPIYIVVTIQQFFITLANQITFIMFFLASCQLFNVSSEHSWLHWRMILAGALGVLLVAVTRITPLTPNFLPNILTIGLPQLWLWHVYRKQDTALIPWLIYYLPIRIGVLAILLISIFE